MGASDAAGRTGAGAEKTGKIFRLGAILFAVTALTGVVLGFVYEITLEPIRRTQERLKNEALSGALPEARSFAPMDIEPGADPVIRDVQQALDGERPVGYCVTVSPRGYGGPLEVVVGITEKGNLRAIRILSHSETPGLGAKAPLPAFSGQYENKQAESLVVVKTVPAEPDQVQAISGATITSNAVTSGVNAALGYVQAISGATITSNAVTSGVNAALEYWRNYLEGETYQ
jgi:electron transport complex protein RnfG